MNDKKSDMKFEIRTKRREKNYNANPTNEMNNPNNMDRKKRNYSMLEIQENQPIIRISHHISLSYYTRTHKHTHPHTHLYV